MTHRIITIDGPAGAGKTTVARRLAGELGCVYVDTGALYRGVAYEILNQDIAWQAEGALAGFLSGLELDYVLDGDSLKLISSGRDITGGIRTPKITELASVTSARPAVRAALLNIQKRIGKTRPAVFDGRDMGTVVFPNADVKFFLFADLEVRARRRYDEMSDTGKNLERVQTDMEKRDSSDTRRKEAPLKPAPDAIMVDSSHLTIPQVVETMLGHILK